MTSFGDVQYPQYPILDTAPNYNYDDISPSRGGNTYRHPIIHEDPYTSSGSSGYGDTSPSGYGPQHYPVHSGPSSSGYGGPVAHAPHPPTKSTTFGGLRRGGSSAMAALTLLSFFAFVNLLQSCLKEHINTMNPTVMVLTNSVLKNRNTKLAEMNSRESTSTSTSSESTSTDEHIEIRPDNLINAAIVTAPPATIAATLTVGQHQKPAAENVQIVNTNSYPYPNPNIDQPNLGSYDSQSNYANQTEMTSSTYTHSDRYRPQYHHNDPYLSPYSQERYPSSHRPHSHYGHSSTSDWDRYENRYFPNHDFYDDSSFMRIY